MHNKIKQHATWLSYLRQHGWQVSYFPVIITHSGWITTTTAQALAACGVDSARATAALRALARGALRYNIRFRQTRQRLYAQLAQGGEAHQPP